jgi:hypothetical protein
METAEKVLALYQQRYFDLSVRHFHEMLRDKHDVRLSYSWVKQALRGAGAPARACKDPRRQSGAVAGLAEVRRPSLGIEFGCARPAWF